MELLDYKRLEVLHGEGEGSTKVRVVLYNKSKDGISMLMDDKPPRYQSFLEGMGARGSVGETYVLLEDSQEIVVFTGVGDIYEDILVVKSNSRKAGASAYKTVSHLNNVEIMLTSEFMAKEVVCGVILASYKHKFLTRDSTEEKRVFINSSCLAVKRAVRIANGQNFARFLADTPANLMTPTLFAEYANRYLQQKPNTTVEVFDREYMERRSMNLLLSVAQGSVQEPRLLVVKYRGRMGNGVDVALVGKGVCFDSGGISLKPSSNMCRMKGDMHGGASVVSVVGLAADMNVEINIDVVVPLVENLPSGSATKPGDVYVGMNGKSVEIDNTDAEGRLILADALAYAQEGSPRYILDVATLTGAMSVALGDAFIGYFTKDDGLSEIISQCGVDASDPTWRMPLSPFYLSFMKSDVADLKNAGGRAGGSATAAIFLNEFVGKQSKWAHLDIAGVMGEHSNKVVYGNGMTGKSVPVLIEIIEKLSAAAD